MQIEADAQIILNKTTGPVRIHMRTLAHQGKVVEAGPNNGQTLFAVSGTSAIFIEGPFVETLFAPNAEATIARSLVELSKNISRATAGSARVRARRLEPTDHRM